MDDAEAVISLLNVIVPIVTPILGAVGVTLKESRSRRTDAGRRKLALDDAQARVAFVNDWWNARRAMDASQGPGSPISQEAERLARTWLDRASRLVTNNQLALPPVEPAMTFTRVALLYEFRTTAGKVVRLVFWIFCGLTTTTVGATISQQIGPERDREDWVRSFVIAGAVIIPLTIALRFVAVAVDNLAARSADQDRQTYGFLRELLLLRRLRGRGAGAVRLMFYASAVGVVGYVAYYARLVTTDPGTTWWLPLTVAGAVVYGTASFGIRAWAISLDRNARHSSVPTTRVNDSVRRSVVEHVVEHESVT